MTSGFESTTAVDSTGCIPPPDTMTCSQWEQDCPCGYKCMPWANDGGTAWNATKCTPVSDMPKQVGEPCTAQDSGVSGVDDCDVGLMCFGVDSETNAGTCIAFCEGNEAQPSCVAECSVCRVPAEGLLTLCLPTCDPLAPDCPDGFGCYPDYVGFTCMPRGSDQGIGEPCAYINDCAPGGVCLGADYVPGCASDMCCAPVCDTAGPEACEGQLAGTSCTMWATKPATCESPTLGVCAV